MNRAALDEILNAALELPWEEIDTALDRLPPDELATIINSDPRGRVLFCRRLVVHAQAREPRKSHLLQTLGLEPNENHADLDAILRRLARNNFSDALTPGEVFDSMWKHLFFPNSVSFASEVKIGRVALRTVRTTLDKKTPKGAEFLFYLFLDPQNCDALVGDLEERHKLIRKKFGQRRANFWYWTQALRSVGPIVWAATRAAVKRLSGLAALVEAWRRIRS